MRSKIYFIGCLYGGEADEDCVISQKDTDYAIRERLGN